MTTIVYDVRIVDENNNPIDVGSHLESIDSKIPMLGQASSIDSVPIVLTSEQFVELTKPNSIESIIASDNIVLPIGSLARTYGRNSAGQIITETVLFGGNVYIHTLNRDSAGNITSDVVGINTYGWVKQ